jgi:hypothetical protein
MQNEKTSPIFNFEMCVRRYSAAQRVLVGEGRNAQRVFLTRLAAV